MKRLVILSCIGLMTLGGLAWAQEEQEETIQSLNQRVKELEEVVRQLKAAQSADGQRPAPVQQVAMQAEPEGENALASLTKRVEAIEGFSILKGIEVHGFVAADYTYNFNRPDSDKNGLILFNEDDNTAALNIANLRVSRSVEEGLGFLVDLDFGDSAEIVGGATRWDNDFANDSKERGDFFELRQAYLTYRFPIGRGLTVKGGKFVTLHGAEIIKTWDNFNYNISNSILFGFAIPFTHTGLMATYPITDFLSVDLGVVNGWDNVADNNDGKTFHGGLTITPHEMLSLYISGSYGSEQDPRRKGGAGAGSKRSMLTTLLTFKPIDRLTFIVDHNWGNESDLLPDASGALTESADWHGIAGYAIVDLTDKLSFALRGEWFSDMDGTRTGVDQDLWEFTPTFAYQIREGLIARLEYRHDESSKKFYEKESRFISGQEVFAGELIYAF